MERSELLQYCRRHLRRMRDGEEVCLWAEELETVFQAVLDLVPDCDAPQGADNGKYIHIRKTDNA